MYVITPPPLLDLMVILCKSTGNYVANRITSKKEKDAYVRGMKEAINAIVRSGGGNSSIADLNMHINIMSFENYKRRIFSNRENERARYCQAFYHAIDVIKSVRARFIDGTSSDGPRIFKHAPEYLEYEDYFK